MIIVANATTGEISERAQSKNELEQMQIDQAMIAEQKEIEMQKETLKISAKNKLISGEKLTQDEADLLIL